MKRKIVGILVTGMIMTSLTGCGTRTKATEQNVAMEEESIVVTDGEDSEEIAIETEGEITDTEEVLADNEEEAEEIDGDIVFYDEIAKYPDYLLTDMEYDSMEDKVVTAVNDIPVYSEEGIKVGHVKSGVTIMLTEHGINTRWYRFENPISSTPYDYLCILDDDLPKEEIPLLSAEDVKAAIIDDMMNVTYELPTILDAPTNDMEVYECRILRTDIPGDFGLRIVKAFNEDDTFQVGDYKTYYVECEEDEEFAICRLYYKDPRF